MGDWVSHNIGVVVWGVGVLVAAVGGWAVMRVRITQLETENGKREKEIVALTVIINQHQSDTTLHIDPNRDKQIWNEFQERTMKRFDRLEEKIEKLMLHVPPGAV